MRAVLIGGGSWGTAVARLLARGGHRTTLACRDASQAEMITRRHRNPRYLYDIELPPDLDASAIDETSFDGAELVALAVPSRAFAATVASVADAAAAGRGAALADQGPRSRRPPADERDPGGGGAT